MKEAGEPSRNLSSAVVFTTASSLLVPAVGLFTQPILARALGVEGRGQLTAGAAPAALAVAAATLGLPEALTFLLAKSPALTKRALAWSALLSFVVAGMCLVATSVGMPFLSASDPDISRLITIAILLVFPTLFVGLLRGAAMGLQLWNLVAAERVLSTVSRLLIIVTLWFSGHLTVLSALLATAATPIVGGMVYLTVLRQPGLPTEEKRIGVPTLGPLITFGGRVWLGAVAEIFLGRVGQLLMTPLAGLQAAGLYSVAVTIADVPLIAALAVQSAVFGVNSKAKDAVGLARTSRVTFFFTLLCCGLIGATLPLWMSKIFGPEFSAAAPITLTLLASAVACVPGLLAAGGISAWGRPGVRSFGLAITLVLYAISFATLVPVVGAVGAGLSGLLVNIFMSAYMIYYAARFTGVRRRDFLYVDGTDVKKSFLLLVRFLVRPWTHVAR